MEPGIDYIGVGVGALIMNDEGKFLLEKRGQKARNERGKWKIPGGGMDFGETFETTLAREFKEEYGIVVEITRFLTISNHLAPEEKQHWVAPLFLCRIMSGTPKIMEPDKSEAIGWFTIDEIEKLDMAPSTPKNLRELIANIYE